MSSILLPSSKKTVASMNESRTDRPRLHVPGETALRVIQWGTGVCLCGGLISLALVSFGLTFILLAAAQLTVALCLGIAIPFTRGYQRRIREQVQRFENGEMLAHWTYTDDEWRRFVEVERKDNAGMIAGMSIIFGMMGLLAAVVQFFVVEGSVGFRLVLGIGLLVGLTVLGTIIGAGMQLAGNRRCNRLERRRYDAYFGDEGFYFANKFHTWSHFGRGLESVDLLDDGPIPVLQFDFRVNTGNSSTTQSTRVPIPAGEMATAKRLMGMWSDDSVSD